MVVSDTGPIISLAVINQLELLDQIFTEVHIPNAVWQELNNSEFFKQFPKIDSLFKSRVKQIKNLNKLILITGYGESEAMILYTETGADFLIIDDKKARQIAEELKITCIGTLALLIKAKQKGFLKALKPIFETLIQNRRYYSKNVLNSILNAQQEDMIE